MPAEFRFAVEATLAALTSFTLIGPLGLPWWLPVVVVAVIGTASAGLRHLALSKDRDLWRSTPVPSRRTALAGDRSSAARPQPRGER